MITLLVDTITPRIQYVATLIFQQLGGCPFQIALIHHAPTPASAQSIRIHYAATPPTQRTDIFIHAHHLLFQNDIRPQNIHNHPYLPYLFASTHPSAHLPFDPLAAIFYIVSRYEEYLPYTPDQHQRFPAHQSILHQLNLLQQPIVHIWARTLFAIIQKHHPHFQYTLPPYQFQPTLDIDQPWKFKYRGIKRTIGGIARQLLQADLTALQHRLQIIFNKHPDPYYCFQWLQDLHQQYTHQPPIYFWLLGKPHPLNINPSPHTPALQQLIQHIHTQPILAGIHPGYQTYNNPTQLHTEIKTLQNILQQPITHSRQHFLQLQIPITYPMLLEAGITHDHSMGYADAVGFRAGIAIPFPWFSLALNQSTPLTIHPFQVMDVTLRNYLAYTPQQAIQTIQLLIHQTRQYGGTFCSLWHNSSFDPPHWQGWQAVYTHLLQQAAHS